VLELETLRIPATGLKHSVICAPRLSPPHPLNTCPDVSIINYF
jgi:hypothetical protein